MRNPILLISVAFFLVNVTAEEITPADRETLLETLEKLQKISSDKVDARFLLAISAYRNGISSDTAAMELYLNCIERVEFTEKYKKDSDFREWKRQKDAELSDNALRLALRHQLRWLMLTLQAASVNADRGKLASDALEIVEAIFREPAKLSSQRKILEEDVTSTVFAKAYDIDEVKLKDWAKAPASLEEIFNLIILPPYRNPQHLTELRAGWTRRIQLESLKMEHWAKNQSGRNEGGKGKESEAKEEQRIGTIESLRSPEFTKFILETQPKLQWQMEVDLFKHGDEKGASVRMLAHLEKHIAHVSAKEWTGEFQNLLNPEKRNP